MNRSHIGWCKVSSQFHNFSNHMIDLYEGKLILKIFGKKRHENPSLEQKNEKKKLQILPAGWAFFDNCVSVSAIFLSKNKHFQ